MPGATVRTQAKTAKLPFTVWIATRSSCSGHGFFPSHGIYISKRPQARIVSKNSHSRLGCDHVMRLCHGEKRSTSRLTTEAMGATILLTDPTGILDPPPQCQSPRLQKIG